MYDWTMISGLFVFKWIGFILFCIEEAEFSNGSVAYQEAVNGTSWLANGGQPKTRQLPRYSLFSYFFVLLLNHFKRTYIDCFEVVIYRLCASIITTLISI